LQRRALAATAASVLAHTNEDLAADAEWKALQEEKDRQRRERKTDEDRRRAKAEGQAKFQALPPDSDKRLRAQARLWLVQRAGQLRREAKGPAPLTLDAAFDALCELVNRGELLMPESVAAWIPQYRGARQLTRDSLKRWDLAYRDGGLWALTDGYGSRAGHSLIHADKALYRAVLGRMLADPQATGRDIGAWLSTAVGTLGLKPELPSLRTIQRFREQWIDENRQLWTYMTAPGRWKNHFQVALGSQHEAIVRLNQLWELDSTPGDWLLLDGRHSVVGCIDLFSRRGKLRVSKTSTAYAVGQVFRSAVLDWGVPEVARTDNGQDYVSDYFVQVLTDLEVTQELCIPFASEQKGTVERFLKSVCYGIAKTLPGYIGHNVAEAQEIRARTTFAQRVMTPGEVVEVAMSSADLQTALDEWLEHIYHQDPHTGTGMDGLSPVAKAASYRGAIRTVDPRALDALLMPLAGERTVGKKGIRWDNAHYLNAVLGEYVGEQVRIRYDEADLGRLYVYTDDRFLCVAEDPERTGISRKEVAAVAKAKQKQAMTRHAAELREIKKSVGKNAAAEVIRYRAEQDGKLVAFPQPETPHQTPMLTAGAAAAAARLPRITPSDTPEQAAARAALAADIARVAENVQRLPAGPADRYRHWQWLQREIKNHADTPFAELCISPEDADWWEHYPLSVEFRAQQRLAEDFPDSYRPRRMGVTE
jgi:hypothetical protein